MSIVPLNSSDEKNISCSIQSFLLSFHVAQLLRKCGIAKIKGIPVMELFTYILSNVFRMGSFYMQKRVGSFHEEFSKNTYYRFFQNVHANWLRFTTMLSERMDSWFSHPSQILDIKALGTNVIAMVKRSSKIRYRFDGQMKNIKAIWAACDAKLVL